MPEPNHRPSFQLSEEIQGWPLWVLIEERCTVMVECDACFHRAEWTPAFMDRRFTRFRGKSLWWVAAKLRCGQCRSNYVHLWKK